MAGFGEKGSMSALLRVSRKAVVRRQGLMLAGGARAGGGDGHLC